MVERSAIIIVTLATMGMGIVYLRMGKVSGVEELAGQIRWKIEREDNLWVMMRKREADAGTGVQEA